MSSILTLLNKVKYEGEYVEDTQWEGKQYEYCEDMIAALTKDGGYSAKHLDWWKHVLTQLESELKTLTVNCTRLL